MFIVRGAALAGAGALLGLGLSAGFAHVIGSLLYDVSATDGATYAAICLLVFLVAMAAIYFPIRRATRVDPAVTLRYE
jgi:putative ABC transport system permease protein